MRIAGHEIEALIGRGGMAAVYLGRVVEGPRAGQAVAVKRLLPSLASDAWHRGRFEAEAQLATCLRHAGIVEVMETGIDRGAPYIVMEYVDGRDLGLLLSACRARSIQLPLDFALFVGHAVAEALAFALRAPGRDGRPLGIVHCDVSPSNVFVSSMGEVKLGDFGLARAGRAEGRAQAGRASRAPGNGAGPPQEERSSVFGKVRYLAPEQLRGEPASPASDVFGLGATLHELLTGRQAFPGDDPAQVAHAILRGERRPPSADRPGVPPRVDAVVLRALAERGRHVDAAELATDLARLYDPAIGTPLAIAALVRGVLKR